MSVTSILFFYPTDSQDCSNSIINQQAQEENQRLEEVHI
jgi:hypothetical protein